MLPAEAKPHQDSGSEAAWVPKFMVRDSPTRNGKKSMRSMPSCPKRVDLFTCWFHEESVHRAIHLLLLGTRAHSPTGVVGWWGDPLLLFQTRFLTSMFPCGSAHKPNVVSKTGLPLLCNGLIPCKGWLTTHGVEILFLDLWRWGDLLLFHSLPARTQRGSCWT